MMTPEQILIGLCGVGLSVLGWFARELWAAVQQLRKDLSILERQISTDYVRYDRMQDALRPVTDHLQRIEDKLERKADKMHERI